MLPSIFIFTLLSLSIFYIHIFFTKKLIIIILINYFLYLFFIHKKSLYLFFIQCIFALNIYHQVQLHSYSKTKDHLKLKGIIIYIAPLKNNFYRYSIALLSSNHILNNINIISKSKHPPLKIVYIPFYQKKTTIQKLSLLNSKKRFDNTFFSPYLFSCIVQIQHIIKPSIVLPIIKFFLKIKEKLANYHKKNITDPLHNNFFEGIFLGNSISDKSVRKIFELWGISHYLARSGLHVQIITKIITTILLFLGSNQIQVFFFHGLFLLIFYIISFPSISFLRSLIMFLLYGIIYFFFKVKTTGLHTISISTLIILFYNPFLFLELGTQLTFLATLLLNLMAYVK